MGKMHDDINVATRHGVFLTAAKRMGRDLPLLSNLQLKTGDELHFVGSSADLNRVQPKSATKLRLHPLPTSYSLASA
ncbi:TrkA C-terminal domain-containing protein [Burkholderia sp. PAMC 28687]|uniref:TrkA C-terminal domain-containing protein n=1 Tax=Burkholderia sp. PAMC 28687 TaxID=1795874 RepID=UPI0012D7B9DA|nr:TrkA C-terminal domain-containing protein [Burkholderia sp. PAMC 28687]